MSNGNEQVCPLCLDGRWEVECCNGSGGCSCGGEPVDMGICNACKGSGFVGDDYDARANIRAIQGLHFIGTGPRGMYDVWPNRGNKR